MNDSEIGTDSVTKTPSAKPRSSWMMKSFWGLIGLLAVAAACLISMAVMALNKHTIVEKTELKQSEQHVEIIDLAGNSRIVNSNLVPANPLGDDQSIVKTGTEADDGASEASVLDEEKKEGVKLVEAAKPSAAVVQKKVEVVEAKKPAEKQLAQAEVVKPPKVEKSVQHKESNSQMDNLF